MPMHAGAPCLAACPCAVTQVRISATPHTRCTCTHHRSSHGPSYTVRYTGLGPCNEIYLMAERATRALVRWPPLGSAHTVAAVSWCARLCDRTPHRGTILRFNSYWSPTCSRLPADRSHIAQDPNGAPPRALVVRTAWRRTLWISRLEGKAQTATLTPMGQPSQMALWHGWPPPLKPPLASLLHPSDRHLCCGAASQSWSPRPPASVRPRRMSKPPSTSRSSTSISIFRVSGRLVWPLWRAAGRMSDARWRVWRTGNPSTGRGRAQCTRADDPGVSGPAERCRWAARSVACG